MNTFSIKCLSVLSDGGPSTTRSTASRIDLSARYSDDPSVAKRRGDYPSSIGCRCRTVYSLVQPPGPEPPLNLLCSSQNFLGSKPAPAGDATPMRIDRAITTNTIGVMAVSPLKGHCQAPPKGGSAGSGTRAAEVALATHDPFRKITVSWPFKWRYRYQSRFTPHHIT